MFKSTQLHHCREHRTVFDPSMSLQREEGFPQIINVVIFAFVIQNVPGKGWTRNHGRVSERKTQKSECQSDDVCYVELSLEPYSVLLFTLRTQVWSVVLKC